MEGDLKKMAVFGFRKDMGDKKPERCVTSFWLHHSSKADIYTISKKGE